jgi:hypothetical protein
MLKTRTKFLGLGAGAFAALLMSCATDSNDDGAGSQNVGRTPVTPSGAGSMTELENTDVLLRAAQGSAGAARSDAKACFDGLAACAADGGAPDPACIEKLKGCLPKAPRAPIGCPTFPEPTADDIAAVDDAVGQIDDLTGQVVDFVDDVTMAVDDVVGQILDGGIAFPDGGFPFPPSGGGRGPGGGHNKDNGGRGGFFGDGGVPHSRDGGAPTSPTFPPLDGDASIGGGEICGVPLPVVPIGALAGCADKAAKDLAAGTDPISVATDALGCIEAPFADDIAQLCSDATAMCGQADAPPNICGHVKEACTLLTSP